MHGLFAPELVEKATEFPMASSFRLSVGRFEHLSAVTGNEAPKAAALPQHL
jgi:hypothetical protein